MRSPTRESLRLVWPLARYGWIFRSQPSDYGIDAEIELVADDEATGRLIAAQIKSGASYLRRKTTDGYVYVEICPTCSTGDSTRSPLS